MKYVPFENTNMFLPIPLPEEITYGYYLPGDTKPSEISLAESWSAFKGYYFFLSIPVESANKDALTELEKNLAAEPSLQNPLHTGACWWVNTPGSSAVQSVLQTDILDGNAYINTNVDLGFGTYQLPLFQGASLLFQPEGLLAAGYPVVPGAQPASTANGISLAVTGDEAGILKGQAMISDFSDNEYTGWSAGFRYNMPNLATGNYSSQYYPLFDNTPSTYWVLNVHWDPLHPLDGERSYMAFTGISFGLEKTAGTEDRFQIVPAGETLKTWWRTIYGHPVTMRPVTDGVNPAQLVFQSYANPVKSPAYYLAPKGAFELGATPDERGVCPLLPGLSGTERIQFAPGDEMIFYPGNAANAGNGLVSEGLDNKYTASWVFIQAKSAEAVVYSAAPGVASLYEPSVTTGLLDAYYAPTAQLPAAGSNTFCFPLAPYAGINAPQTNGFSPADMSAFESRLIAVAREQRMASMPIPENAFADGTVITTTTPQGLLASISGLQWKEVLLARNTELEVDFRFTNLPAVLRNAFQTEDLFLVISDAANIGAFDNALSIEGWQFNVDIPIRDPEKDPEHKNILILKFRKGAVTNLLFDTTQWTAPVTFNYDANQVVSTQSWLMDYCNEAITMAESNPPFASFASIVQNPEWYGILALRTNIDLGNFPKDLRGLLGAMDLTRFYAHHVGVQVSFVQEEASSTNKPASNTNKPLEVKKSNMFGMISYIDPAYQQTQGKAAGAGPRLAFVAEQNSVADVVYAYKVLILQVIFANTVLTNFDSKLELTARKWFEEAASLNVPGKDAGNDPANYSMIFNGHYENHDGHRTYTFLTQQDLTYQYFLTSKVLNYIEFVKAQFQTISSVVSDTDPDSEDIIARFTFYGFLNFTAQDKFDCFSYGAGKNEALQKGRGLYFSNLSLDVNFALNTNMNTTSGLTIKLNPRNVSFDQSMSTFREKSFVAAFPISPNAILQGSSDNTPKKLRYLPVLPPVEFSTAGIQPEWYAINFDMHWGGPGSLASQAGFIPQLMLAWSPGATSVNVGIFVRLPGSGGGNTFSIQNVLTLSAGPFQLKQVVHDGDKISYNFFLINLSLSLFGVRLPPAGNTNLVLIGDAEEPGTLGWYGAYINK